MDAKTGEMSGSGCPVNGGVRSLLGRTNRDWWPEALAVDILAPERRVAQPDGRGLRLCRGVQEARLSGAQGRPHRADDRQPAVVAGRLRALRAVLHPHGVARGRHLSHRRRARRRQQRAAALRAAQQLAGQRQPRQGAAPAVADQAEIRRRRSAGPTCSSSPAMSRSNRWAARCSASAAAARTCSSPSATSTGAPRRNGSNEGVGNPHRSRARAEDLEARWRRSRWASSTSIPKARAAIPTRCSRRATSR